MKLLKIIVLSTALFSFDILSNQQPGAHKYVKRFDISGVLLGEVQPSTDNDSMFQAIRYIYDSSKTLLIRTEFGVLESWQNDSIAPVNWTGFVISHSMVVEYDDYGRKISEGLVDNFSNQKTLTQYSYDQFNRIECTAVRMNPEVFQTLPDSACKLSVEGNLGPDRITKYTYDDFDNLLVERRAYGTSIEQIYANNEYDLFGRLEYTTDANGNKSHITYHPDGNIKRFYFPSKHVVGAGTHSTSDYEEFTYDANGNMRSKRKRDGRTIWFTYNALNQQVSKDIPSSTALDVTYEYDLRGLQKTATYPYGKGIFYEYDGLGNLVEERNNTTYQNYRITHTYDDHGNKISTTHPDGKVFVFDYDGKDRFENIRHNNLILLSNFYDDFGKLDNIQRTNRSSSDFDYDEVGRVNGIGHTGSASSSDVYFGMSFNPASQLATINYDNLSYRHNKAYSSKAGSYEVNGLNQYTSIAGLGIQHEANGNLTNDGTYSYTYDVENRLIGTSRNNTTFTYDATGRLSTMVSGGVTYTFLFDGDALISEYKGSNMNNRWVHGINVDEPLIEFGLSSTSSYYMHYLHSNHQGSVILASGGSGSSNKINTYDSFGVPGEANQGRFGYTGQLYLKEVGLNYYKARIYHPKLGRFLQTDPVGYEDQMNLYAYVGNDPVNMVDPSGKWIIQALKLLWEGGKALHAAYRGKVAATAAVATVTSISIETNQLREAALENFEQGQSNANNFSGDLESLVKAEMERKANLSKSLLPKAVDAGKAVSGVYNGTSLAADALSIKGGADSAIDEIKSSTQTNHSKSNHSHSSRTENGMSSEFVKICSGTGAQRDGCR